MLNIISPDAVVVSMPPSLKERKPTSIFLQLLDNINKFPERATEPVKTPDDGGVAIFQFFHALGKTWPFSFRPAYLVGKDMLLFTASLFECIKLQVQFLG
jgi:hypothetical protein